MHSYFLPLIKEISSFFSYVMTKIYRTKQQNNEPHRKSEQWNPLLIQMHPQCIEDQVAKSQPMYVYKYYYQPHSQKCLKTGHISDLERCFRRFEPYRRQRAVLPSCSFHSPVRTWDACTLHQIQVEETEIHGNSSELH